MRGRHWGRELRALSVALSRSIAARGGGEETVPRL